MIPLFFVGNVIAWVCMAVPNAFLMQLLLRRMRGEAPHYQNAFFVTATSGVAAQLAGFALLSSVGAPASLLGSLILVVFLYSKLLRLPSGGEVSHGQSLAIICAQFILTSAILLSFFYIFLELGASSQSGIVASGAVSLDTWLADYGSYLAFMLVFLVIFFAYTPYRKSRKGTLTLPIQASTSEKDFVETSEWKGSTGMNGMSTDKNPDPSKASENDPKTKENSRSSVAPGILQGPSGAIRISGIAIILSCLFPPWCTQTRFGPVHVGYSFLLNPPGPGTTVNTGLLLVQICAVFLCGIAFWLAGRK